MQWTSSTDGSADSGWNLKSETVIETAWWWSWGNWGGDVGSGTINSGGSGSVAVSSGVENSVSTEWTNKWSQQTVGTATMTSSDLLIK